MQNVCRDINSAIKEFDIYRVNICADISDTTRNKNNIEYVDTYSFSDLYICYLNTEFGYNFISTVPLFKLSTNVLNKFYIDLKTQCVVIFSKYTVIKENFVNLHKRIMRLIIDFCCDYGLFDVDELQLNADGLKESIIEGKWTPSTDSCFKLSNDNGEQKLLSV